jgi:prevent-host-death family protein
MNIGTFEAKTHFSEIIEEVQKGKDFIITKRGKPVAKIIPLFEKDINNRKEIINLLFNYQNISNDKFNIKESINLGRK